MGLGAHTQGAGPRGLYRPLEHIDVNFDGDGDATPT
jgi:hypothetical protein